MPNPGERELCLIVEGASPPLEVVLEPDFTSADGVSLDLGRLIGTAKALRLASGQPEGKISLHIRDTLPEELPIYSFADDRVVVDTGRRQLLVDDTPVAINGQPYDLLTLLASRPDYIWPREELYKRFWQRPHAKNNLAVLVHAVKDRLGRELSQAVHNTRGVGYTALSTLK
jgi:hypothetical protein